MRYRAILRHWLATCGIIGLTMLVPLAVAVFAGELRAALILVAPLGIGLTLGLIGRRLTTDSLDVRSAAVVVALAYLSFGILAAVPFIAVAGPLDGFFEAMSGVTTTGLSVLEPSELPRSLLFLRAWSQWLGGGGVLVLSLAVVIGTGRTVVEFHRAQFGADQEILGSVTRTARASLTIYVLLSAACFATLLAVGMDPFHAAVQALSTVSTGGFSSYSSPEPFHGVFGLSVIPFMLLGATGVPVLYYLRHEGLGALRRDIQPLLLVGFAVGLIGVLYAASVDFRSGPGDGIFHVVSALTTTGYVASAPEQWSTPLRVLVLAAMIVGGSSASTAGGLKLWRVLLTGKVLLLSLVRLSLPREAVVPIHHRGDPLDTREQLSVLSFVVLYLAVLGISTAIFAVSGYGAGDSLFECASAIGTVGMSTGITGAGLDAHLKAVLIFDMWAGRLEIIPVLLCLYYRTWWHKEHRK